MNETPKSSSAATEGSTNTDTVISDSDQEEFTPSVLDEPGVDVGEYLAAKRRATNRTRRFLQFALGVAVVAIPVTYLKINGRLNSNTVRQALNQKVEEPVKSASDKSAFSLGTDSADTSGITGTVAKTKKSKAIAQDLTTYVYKDLKRISPDELKALTAFDKVSGKNFTRESTTFAAVRDIVIPTYERFLQNAMAIKPKTPEVRATHRTFVQAAKVKSLAFRHLLEGQGDQSGAWQFGVKAEFAASESLSNLFKVQIKSVAEDQGVKIP